MQVCFPRAGTATDESHGLGFRAFGAVAEFRVLGVLVHKGRFMVD